MRFARHKSTVSQTAAAFLRHSQLQQLDVATTHFRGTLYELGAKEWLEQKLGCTLLRTGGAHDNGIDLLGTWDSRPLLVQCKNYATKIKASTIREMGGIFGHHVKRAHKSTYFFLVLPFPLTKQAQLTVDMSSVPIVHVKLLPYKLVGHNQYQMESYSPVECSAVYMNPAASKLAGPEKLHWAKLLTAWGETS